MPSGCRQKASHNLSLGDLRAIRHGPRAPLAVNGHLMTITHGGQGVDARDE
jgi:hypothetical protein